MRACVEAEAGARAVAAAAGGTCVPLERRAVGPRRLLVFALVRSGLVASGGTLLFSETEEAGVVFSVRRHSFREGLACARHAGE